MSDSDWTPVYVDLDRCFYKSVGRNFIKTEVMVWLIGTGGGDPDDIKWNLEWHDGQPVFYFADHATAMLFKLTWGGR